MSLTRKSFLLLSFIILGCTSRSGSSVRLEEPHGMSAFPQSNYSYIGYAAREIDLALSFKKSEVSTIKAVIQVPYDYSSSFQYKWKLGSQVELVEGTLTGTLSPLRKGQSSEVTIRVKNFDSKENRFVRFEVFGVDPNKRIFSDGIVSSQQESSFESIVQEVEKIHASQ